MTRTARTVSARDLETMAHAAHERVELPGPEGGWATAVINGHPRRAWVASVNIQRLRRSAALMRQRAEAALLGPWRDVFGRVSADVAGYGEAVVCDPVRKSDATHIASWHPAIALAVADWLSHVADAREALDGIARHQGESPGQGSEQFLTEERHALAVANAYLGETP